MTGFHTSLLLTLAMLGTDSWQLSWTPDPSNVILQIVTDCPGFRAVSRYTISPSDDHATVHRTHGPAGAHCQVVAEVMRVEEGDPDPDHEWVGESAYLVVDE